MVKYFTASHSSVLALHLARPFFAAVMTYFQFLSSFPPCFLGVDRWASSSRHTVLLQQDGTVCQHCRLSGQRGPRPQGKKTKVRVTCMAVCVWLLLFAGLSIFFSDYFSFLVNIITPQNATNATVSYSLLVIFTFDCHYNLQLGFFGQCLRYFFVLSQCHFFLNYVCFCPLAEKLSL